MEEYTTVWVEAVGICLALAIDRLANAGSTIAHWQSGNEFNVNTFRDFSIATGS